MDRVYRLGHSRTVRRYCIIMKDSVEHWFVAYQVAKTALGIVSVGVSSSSGRRTWPRPSSRPSGTASRSTTKMESDAEGVGSGDDDWHIDDRVDFFKDAFESVTSSDFFSPVRFGFARREEECRSRF